jgi:hypothetical protein
VKSFPLPFSALSILEIITVNQEWERIKVSRKLTHTQHITQWTTGHRTNNIRTVSKILTIQQRKIRR